MPRTCARCGKTPADGYASIATVIDGKWIEHWYCHPDDETQSDCYTKADLW